jgi:hypothetical protein
MQNKRIDDELFKVFESDWTWTFKTTIPIINFFPSIGYDRRQYWILTRVLEL